MPQPAPPSRASIVSSSVQPAEAHANVDPGPAEIGDPGGMVAGAALGANRFERPEKKKTWLPPWSRHVLDELHEVVWLNLRETKRIAALPSSTRPALRELEPMFATLQKLEARAGPTLEQVRADIPQTIEPLRVLLQERAQALAQIRTAFLSLEGSKQGLARAPKASVASPQVTREAHGSLLMLTQAFLRVDPPATVKAYKTYTQQAEALRALHAAYSEAFEHLKVLINHLSSGELKPPDVTSTVTAYNRALAPFFKGKDSLRDSLANAPPLIIRGLLSSAFITEVNRQPKGRALSEGSDFLRVTLGRQMGVVLTQRLAAEKQMKLLEAQFLKSLFTEVDAAASRPTPETS